MQQIKGATFTEQLEPVALIVLEDSVRENMVDILRYIKENQNNSSSNNYFICCF